MIIKMQGEWVRKRNARRRRWNRCVILWPRVVRLEGRGRVFVWLTAIYRRRSESLGAWLYLHPADLWPHHATGEWGTGERVSDP